MLDIFFFEAFAEEAEFMKGYLEGSDITAGYTDKTIQEYGCKDPPGHVISVRTQSAIPPVWAPKLKGILTRSTGYDHVKRYLKEVNLPIPTQYLPHYCARSVAEQALMLWMALLRRLRVQERQFHEFCRDGLTGNECLAKKIMVVGVGNIGGHVYKIARGLEMDVVGCDIVEKHDFVKYVPFEEGIRDADMVVCAMNLTEENYGYFTEEKLRMAKKGLVFVNISRGELSPSPILLRLLQEGHLAGVGIDVYEDEKKLGVALRMGKGEELEEGSSPWATWKMSQLDNVICTPHNAFNTIEATQQKTWQSVDAIKYFQKNGKWSPKYGVVEL